MQTTTSQNHIQYKLKRKKTDLAQTSWQIASGRLLLFFFFFLFAGLPCQDMWIECESKRGESSKCKQVTSSPFWALEMIISSHTFPPWFTASSPPPVSPQLGITFPTSNAPKKANFALHANVCVVCNYAHLMQRRRFVGSRRKLKLLVQLQQLDTRAPR